MAKKNDSTLWNKFLWAVVIVCIIIGANMGSWFLGLVSGIVIVVYLQNKFGNGEEATKQSSPVFSASQNKKDFTLEDKIPVMVAAEISYEKADGTKSDRLINIENFGYHNGGMYIQGFCHKRCDDRTFKVSRVKSFKNIETGEYVNNIPHFLKKSVAPAPQEGPKISLSSSSQLNGHSEQTTKARDNEDLVALMFIARADGKFTDTEKQVIKNHLLREYKDENAETVLKALYKMNPSRERFRQALKALASRTDSEKQMIAEAVLEMSDHLNKRNEITESAINLALKELGTDDRSDHGRAKQHSI